MCFVQEPGDVYPTRTTSNVLFHSSLLDEKSAKLGMSLILL